MIVNKVGNTFGGLKFYVKSLNQSNKFFSQLEWESNSGHKYYFQFDIPSLPGQYVNN